MTTQRSVAEAAHGLTERRLEPAGMPTTVLEGGDGPPVVLLHGPGANATHWMSVLPALLASHRVVAPDLPGHSAGAPADDGLDADRVLAWLGELIDQTCDARPALVGYALGGAVAARYVAAHGARIDRLVLVDALGLGPFDPTPDFGLALHQFAAEPTPRTHEALWQQCTFDLDGLRDRMGERWTPFAADNVDRARRPGVQSALGALMAEFGVPAIPGDDLARIDVPTTLVWGRHDRATRLAVAEEVGRARGWPLHVIEDCADDPPVERPEAFLDVLRPLLG